MLTNVPNESDTLKEGIDNWYRYKQERLTVEDVHERATAYCERALRMGIQGIVEGNYANVVVLDAPTPIEALRISPVRSAVIRRGKRVE